jgi:hypothetical protein
MAAKVAAKHHLGDLPRPLERLRNNDPNPASLQPPNELCPHVAANTGATSLLPASRQHQSDGAEPCRGHSR